jgi:23S rRNA (guanosine2251-2'-O)-methyltransferase
LFLWGRHAVLAALANFERRVAALYATDGGAEELHQLITSLPTTRSAELPEIKVVERSRLDALHAGDAGEKAVHQGMAAAVWPLQPPALEDLLADIGESPVRLILLDQLSDPRNVGAIMRSARAFGVDAIITTHRNAPEESGSLGRTATGALEHIPLVRVVNLARAIEMLQEANITVAGLAGDGEMPISALGSMPRLAIVLGAEGAGLRRLTRDHCDHLVRIEMDAAADSLNVSNAAAIALYAAQLTPATRHEPPIAPK